MRKHLADPDTARIQRVYDRDASRYDRGMGYIERALFAGGREWVCHQARGDVLELALGTGRNLEHYPAEVRLTGVELSPAMLAIARQRCRALGRDADLRLGDAQSLDLPDASFDTVVSTLALCSIPDHHGAVREARRVLRPGGRLLLLEHVRSPLRAVRIAQELVEPILLWLEGDHLLREPLDVVTCHGFAVERLERSKLGIVERLAARLPED